MPRYGTARQVKGDNIMRRRKDGICLPENQDTIQVHTHTTTTTKNNSVALVRERTIPTERPPPVGKVSANFFG